MAIQIFRQNQPSVGENLGSALGTGLSNLISGSLAQKQAQAQSQRLAQAYQSFGFSPQEAMGISSLPERLQMDLVKSLGERGGLSALPQSQQMMQQSPQAEQSMFGMQPQQPQNIAQRLAMPTLAQQRENRKLDLAERQAEESKQLRIASHNKPFLKKIGDVDQTTGKMLDLADSMFGDVLTGEVASGWEGAIKGKIGQQALNDPSQRFLTASNNLAEMIVRGVPTGFKLRFAQEMKPNLSQSTETQKSELRRVMQQAIKGQLYNRVTQMIVEENGGMQPLNLESQVQKRFSEINNKMKELPEAINEPDGTIATDNDTGLQFVVKNGTWRPNF